MNNLILNAVGEEAIRMFGLNGRVAPWRIARNLGISDQIAVEHLLKLGYVQKSLGSFVLKDDSEKTTAKKSERLAESDLSFKVSNDLEFPNQDFIWQNREEDYTTFSLNELRTIASNKGIKVAFSMTKGELIKKLKSNLK